MTRFAKLGTAWILVSMAAVGCGSSKELAPATTTPQANEAEVKAGMEKSRQMAEEMMKKQGKSMPNSPPGGGS